MAYVVARSRGRFEVRESVHTPRGPRARSLASFQVLTAGVLVRARERAVRPFSEEAVIASAQRLGAHVEAGWDARRFVDASKRMSAGIDRPSPGPELDPGASLLGLLNFADMVSSSVGPRRWEPLTFPVLRPKGKRQGRQTQL